MGSWKNGSLSVSLLPINFKLISETQGALTCKKRKACAGRQRVQESAEKAKQKSQNLSARESKF